MDSVNVFMLLTPKTSVAFIFSSESVECALSKLRQSGYVSVPVIDDEGKFLGTISEGDFLWAILDNGMELPGLTSRRVAEIVNTQKNTAVKADVSIDEIIKRVETKNYVPVIDDRGYFIGIVTRGDVIRHLKSNLR